MESAYVLRIDTDSNKYDALNAVLGVKPTSTDYWWEVEIKDSREGLHYLLQLIEVNFSELQTVGLDKGAISIWYYYEFDEQCNMEFDSDDLKRMGECGITLCISCWNG